MTSIEIFGQVLRFVGAFGTMAALLSVFVETVDAIDNKSAGLAVYCALKGVIVLVAFILLLIAGVLLSKGAA